jgi:hypothetical protein
MVDGTNLTKLVPKGLRQFVKQEFLLYRVTRGVIPKSRENNMVYSSIRDNGLVFVVSSQTPMTTSLTSNDDLVPQFKSMTKTPEETILVVLMAAAGVVMTSTWGHHDGR